MPGPAYVKWLQDNFGSGRPVQSTQPKRSFGALNSRRQLNAIPKDEPGNTVTKPTDNIFAGLKKYKQQNPASGSTSSDTNDDTKDNSGSIGGVRGWHKSFNDTFEDTDYFKNYGSLYDFQTKGTADEWMDFINSDEASKYYSDLGIVGDDAAFYDWFNKGRSKSLQDIYESQDAELLRYLGNDTAALMAMNEAYVNSDDFANYTKSEDFLNSVGEYDLSNADLMSNTVKKYNQVAAEGYLKSNLDTPSQMNWTIDDLQKLFGDDYEFSDKLAEKTEGSSPMTKKEAQSRRAMGELTLKDYDPLAKSFNDSYSGVDMTDEDVAYYAALLEQDSLSDGEKTELQTLLNAESRPAFKAASLVRNYFPEFSYKAR